jgi:membrane-bound ClpP family serine protease
LVDPDAAFLLAIEGILLLFLEVIAGTRAVASTIGFVALAAGAFLLTKSQVTGEGSVLLIAASLCFFLELCVPGRFAAGAVGTLLLAGASLKLVARPPIHPLVALLPSLMIGVITTILVSSARRARQNKRRDLVKREL